MKSRMILLMLPVLLAMIMLAGSEKAEAADIAVSVGGVGVSVGGGHHYHNGGYVRYRTADPVYSTWYPDRRTTYTYVPAYSSSYYDNRYGNGYSNSGYIYSTDSTSYNGWYGSGRSGHGGYYSNGHGRYRHDGSRHRR